MCFDFLDCPAQGADMELMISGEDVAGFVTQWVAAANNAAGQAVKVCNELPVRAGL